MFHHIGIIRQEGYFRTKLSCSIGAATTVLGLRLPVTALSVDAETLVQSNRV